MPFLTAEIVDLIARICLSGSCKGRNTSQTPNEDKIQRTPSNEADAKLNTKTKQNKTFWPLKQL